MQIDSAANGFRNRVAMKHVSQNIFLILPNLFIFPDGLWHTIFVSMRIVMCSHCSLCTNKVSDTSDFLCNFRRSMYYPFTILRNGWTRKCSKALIAWKSNDVRITCEMENRLSIRLKTTTTKKSVRIPHITYDNNIRAYYHHVNRIKYKTKTHSIVREKMKEKIGRIQLTLRWIVSIAIRIESLNLEVTQRILSIYRNRTNAQKCFASPTACHIVCRIHADDS